MHDKQRLECNLIVDDDFMNKDVSDLVQEDIYLFHTNGNKIWLYKDGVIVEAAVDVNGHESAFGVPYLSGTLQEYAASLGDNNV